MPGPFENWPAFDINRLRDIYSDYGNKYDNMRADPERRINRSKLYPIGLTLPEKPAMFQPDPLVVGSSEVARLAKGLIDLDPILKRKLGIIRQGPTRGIMNMAIDSGMAPGSFEGTNVLGITSHNNGKYEVGLQPGINDKRILLETLIHELGHVTGMNEQSARAVEKVIEPEPYYIPKGNGMLRRK